MFQIADAQFHAGVVAVHPVGFCRRQVAVGGECVMSPIFPQRLLFGIGQAGASDYQTHRVFCFVDLGDDGGFGHLRHPVGGVADINPVGVVYVLYGLFDVGISWDSDEPLHSESFQLSYCFPGPKAFVGPYGDRTGRSGPSHPVDRLDHKTGVSLLRGAFAQAMMNDLPGVRPGGYQRMVSQLSGVTIASAFLALARNLTNGGVHINDQRLVAGTGAR